MDKRSFSDISPDEINKEEEEYESESDINNVNHAIKRFKLGEENFMERKVEQVNISDFPPSSTLSSSRLKLEEENYNEEEEEEEDKSDHNYSKSNHLLHQLFLERELRRKSRKMSTK